MCHDHHSWTRRRTGVNRNRETGLPVHRTRFTTVRLVRLVVETRHLVSGTYSLKGTGANVSTNNANAAHAKKRRDRGSGR